MGGEGISDYEKQRLARISENKSRLEALGLPHLASSVLASFSKQQPKSRSLSKRKGKGSGEDGNDEDEEYRPSDDDQTEEDDDKEDGSSASEEEEEEGARTSSYSQRKGKNRSYLISSNVKKRSFANECPDESFDDEAALRQAIALSLKPASSDLAGTPAGLSQNSTLNMAREDTQEKKYMGKTQEFSSGGKKAAKLNKSRVQLTEDEVVACFFFFDVETGKGYITPRDVKRMVSSHDFSWTDIEIGQMIQSFDNDGDGKLSLEDFRSIMVRCRIMQEGTKES